MFDDTETNCSDQLDNDGDGLFDCMDMECINEDSCSSATLLFPMETFDTTIDEATWTAPLLQLAWLPTTKRSELSIAG